MITDVGRRAIQSEPEPVSDPNTLEAPAGQASAASDAEVPPRRAQQSLILALLARPSGASLEELAVATGWLPHTMRAALVRLRQKGGSIEREQGKEKISRYRLAAATATASAPSAD